MKRVKYIVLVFCLTFMPILCANAEEAINVEKIDNFNVIAGDNITSTNEINGSSIIAGNNITTENTVKGIDMVLGNNITYKSNSDYSVVLGNTINVTGTTNNDAFIFGNAITFDEEYKGSRDVFIFGSSVILKGEILRNVTIYASSVILEDVKVSGNVTITASSIDVKNANIDSTLSYNEDAEVTISSDAVINESNTFINKIDNKSIQDVVIDHIIDYASLLFTFAALALVLPMIFKKIENKTKDISATKILTMLGYGLFLLIIIPIIFVLLMTIAIGIPLSIIAIATYIGIIFLSTIFSGYFIGLIVWKKIIKKETNILLVGLLGISIIKVLSLIPYVGVIITFVSLLLSFSVFTKLFTKDA